MFFRQACLKGFSGLGIVFVFLFGEDDRVWRKRVDVPESLARGRERFEAWRRSHLSASSDFPISPQSTMTRREAASRLIRTGHLGNLHEVLGFDPGHPLLQIGFAGHDEYAAQAAFLREYDASVTHPD